METSNAKWTRPHFSGPAIAWRTIDAKEKLTDNTFVDVRLSIQDIPEERYEEALDHLCQYFLADEVLNKCMKVTSDVNGVNANRMIWNCCLKQGMSIGAFKLNSNGELGELVGAMALLVSSDENNKIIDDIWMNSNSQGVKNIFTFVHDATDQFDIRKIYGVDRYIHEWGLSVKPSFRGQKLGVRLLEVWTDIGRKYGITVGTGNFSAPMSQIQAERAGFKTIHTAKYNETSDESGLPVFPNVEADALTVMVKML